MPDAKDAHRGFFTSLFASPVEPEHAPDPLGPSRQYCGRLLAVYKELNVANQLVSPLPDWVRLPEFALDIDGLQRSPRVQAALADCTAYTPGKWLLEQELNKRTRIRGESALTFGAGEGGPTWDESMGDVYDSAQDVQLAGLAFSGGGIRSATFCLGVLQALAEKDVIPRFDYLSSVSGGGYIHQWFASWISRAGDCPSGLAAVQKQLKPLPEAGAGARWPSQVQWLRRYSSYLTPQRGAFSADTWTMLCIWFRNTFLNQIILFGFLAACLLAVRLVAAPFDPAVNGASYKVAGILLLVFVTVYQMYGSVRLARALYSLRTKASPACVPPGAMSDGQVVRWVVMPNLLSAYGVALLASSYPQRHWFPAFYGVLWSLEVFGLLVGMSLSGMWPRGRAGWSRSHAWIAVLAVLTAALLAAASGLTVDRLAATMPGGQSRLGEWADGTGHHANGTLGSRTDTVKFHQQFDSPGSPSSVEIHYSKSAEHAPLVPMRPQELFSVVAPLLFLGLEFLAIRIQVGVLGNQWAESRREWMARLGAWAAICSLVWFLLGCIAWISPSLCGWLIDGSNWHKVWAALLVVLLHGMTLYAGASGKSDGKPQPGAFLGYKPIDLVGMIGAPLCVLTLLILMAGLIHGCLMWMGARWERVDGAVHWLTRWSGIAWLNRTEAGAFVFQHLGVRWLAHTLAHAVRLGPTIELALGLAVLFVFFAWRVDINEFSIHGFYRNRLARCYLGATNMMRTPDPFTKFDEHSENTHSRAENGLAVSDLLPTRFGGTGGYDGPFPVFCSTVNLTFGEDLAYQERKGASFAFTPMYCGYHVGWTAESVRTAAKTTFNGYVPSRDYAYNSKGILLAAAAAISGAALNPNQGYSSQPALAFLMTLFNVRLGWWVPNPRKPEIWPWVARRSTPRFGLRYLLGELFGLANDTTNYVCLCDGGKFDNMGLYELVRRRCSLIVVCDAESDPDYEFEGIGGAIAKCRTDFGTEIKMDLRPLRRDPVTGNSHAHFVKGDITYPVPPGPRRHQTYTGQIFYIKSAVVGDEPGDILHHKLTHAAFPNDSTVNQWFTESQFESYRRLGQISGEQFLEALGSTPSAS